MCTALRDTSVIDHQFSSERAIAQTQVSHPRPNLVKRCNVFRSIYLDIALILWTQVAPRDVEI